VADFITASCPGGADGGSVSFLDFRYSRGGGYGPRTPREGWDHAQTWVSHALSVTGLQPQFITAELTTADANPKMAHLKPLAAESLNKALAAIDQLWTADEDAA
jgi:FMN-dependent NADH-azoreductase